MENLLTRYRNVSILVGVLFAQILGLAIQVRRVKENESTLLIRVWTVTAITPLEKGIVGLESGMGNLWHNYIYLRGVRKENRDLKQEIQQLRLNEVRISEDAQQAHRLQVLLGFKEQYLSKTVAAQVIGSGGSDRSRVVFIDKGDDAKLLPEMPVITADGIVGKVVRVFAHSAQVLLVNDENSGAGAILEKSRLQGILKGTPVGGLILDKVMSDEQIQPGDRVLTSGGDGIFPKGMPVGTVTQVSKGKDSFLNIRIKPAADLSKLEEVLVITKQEEKEPSVADAGNERASDILSRRLPSVPDQPPAAPAHSGAGALKTNATAALPSASTAAHSIAGAQPASLAGSATTPSKLSAPKTTAPRPRATQPPADVPVSAPSATENPGNGQTIVKTITDDATTPAPVKPIVKSPASSANPQSKPAQPESDQQ
ncbi:MAG TPA: rod shape-determining protein MreC [Terriglobales bacterium]|jgi:rod shape-determining protein MreC